MKSYEMPIGLTMALALNPDAMEKFATLTEAEKRQIVNGTHNIRSKEEMQKYVEGLAKR